MEHPPPHCADRAPLFQSNMHVSVLLALPVSRWGLVLGFGWVGLVWFLGSLSLWFSGGPCFRILRSSVAVNWGLPRAAVESSTCNLTREGPFGCVCLCWFGRLFWFFGGPSLCNFLRRILSDPSHMPGRGIGDCLCRCIAFPLPIALRKGSINGA